MNFNTAAVRMLLGAIVGVQIEGRVRALVPGNLGPSPDLVELGAVIVYLSWGGRPNAGGLGNVLDGAAVGVGAIAAARVVRLPI